MYNLNKTTWKLKKFIYNINIDHWSTTCKLDIKYFANVAYEEYKKIR